MVRQGRAAQGPTPTAEQDRADRAAERAARRARPDRPHRPEQPPADAPTGRAASAGEPAGGDPPDTPRPRTVAELVALRAKQAAEQEAAGRNSDLPPTT